MRKNIMVAGAIIFLFIVLFFVSNFSYFEGTQHTVEDGHIVIGEEQLRFAFALNGQWRFYPNKFVLDETAKEKSIPLQVPSNMLPHVMQNEDGLTYGTYSLTVDVPRDGQYGLYMNTIRQASRIFINGHEVGGRGNSTSTLADFQGENGDQYVVFVNSENKQLRIAIQVTAYNYPQAGIGKQIYFGAAEKIQQLYWKKLILNALVSLGYIVLGMIYLFSFSFHAKRKEELYFGLFAILAGVYMSVINEKIFFILLPFLSYNIRIELAIQLGLVPLILLCFTLFLYYMYPNLANKKMLYALLVMLCLVFLKSAFYNPLYVERAVDAQEQMLRKVLFLIYIAPAFLYNIIILIRALDEKLKETKYIFVIVISAICYSVILALNFLFETSIEYSDLLLFIFVLVSFSLLLSYRSTEAAIESVRLASSYYSTI